MKPTTPERLQWFFDRIGTYVIFKEIAGDSFISCKCETCKKGVRINSKEHAQSLYNDELIGDFIYFEKPKP